MKALLAALGGFIATTVIYGAGALTAVYFTIAEPVPLWTPDDGASAWTTEPVAASAEGFERIPSRFSMAAQASEQTSDQSGEAGTVDPTLTSAIAVSGEAKEPARDDEALLAHVQWCSERYRSYRVEDDSYRPYRGGRQACISPFSDAIAARDIATAGYDQAPEAETQATVQLASAGGWSATDLSADHVDACYSRYRSYRPEDNSYQPYGGGPRRQCE